MVLVIGAFSLASLILLVLYVFGALAKTIDKMTSKLRGVVKAGKLLPKMGSEDNDY